MKPLAYALVLLMSVLSATGYSQANNAKPKQFASYPDVISCPESELSKVFTSNPGQNIGLTFSDNFLFNGSVTSNLARYSNLQSASIRSPFFNNTVFSLSKITDKDNTVRYVGHIFNVNYFDAYELRKNDAGNYQLVKMETGRMLQDCAKP